MSRRHHLVYGALLLLLTATAASAHGQAPRATTPETFTLRRVALRGSSVYSEAEILAATGLSIGGHVTQDQLQHASNRLGNSGVFSTVSYQFMAIAGGGVVVTFNVRDNPQSVSISFENLVWMERSQLLTALRRRLPLFRERIPLA